MELEKKTAIFQRNTQCVKRKNQYICNEDITDALIFSRYSISHTQQKILDEITIIIIITTTIILHG